MSPLAAQRRAPAPRAVLPTRAGPAHAFANPGLAESSALVASRRHPGVLWSLGDSGNPPDLFATDTTGADLGRVRVRDAINRDWEDLSLGPCNDGGDCLYIADTGDNAEQRPDATLYRLREPTPPGRGARASSEGAVERLRFTYPDGPHDVEALYVDAAGDSWLVSKGRSGGIRLYVLRQGAWKARQPVRAELVGPVPLPAGTGILDLVTGASLSPDGSRVAVRTYEDVYVLPRDGAGRLGVTEGLRCDIRRLFGEQPQGEGITWLPDGGMAVSTENRWSSPASVALLRCPLEALK